LTLENSTISCCAAYGIEGLALFERRMFFICVMERHARKKFGIYKPC